MSKYKLSNLSFSFIVICLMNSTLLGILFPFMINNSKTSVFMSLVYSYFIGLLILILFLKIFKFLPDLDIFEKIDRVFSKVSSKIVSFILGLLVFSLSLIIFFRVTTFVSHEFLIDTPVIFITLILILPIVYLLMFNFDLMGRMATFNSVLGILIIVFNILALRKGMDLENLKPILNNDFVHIAKSSIVFAFSYYVPLFLTLVIPKNNITNNKNISKSLVKCYSFSFILIGFIFFTIISVLGVNVCEVYTYPSYVVLKNINVLNFIENIENISIIVFLLFMSFTVSFCLMFLKRLISFHFKLDKKKSFISTTCLIVIPIISIIFLSLPYEGFLNLIDTSYIVGLIYFLIFVICLLVLIVGKIKKVK